MAEALGGKIGRGGTSRGTRPRGKIFALILRMQVLIATVFIAIVSIFIAPIFIATTQFAAAFCAQFVVVIMAVIVGVGRKLVAGRIVGDGREFTGLGAEIRKDRLLQELTLTQGG